MTETYGHPDHRHERPKETANDAGMSAVPQKIDALRGDMHQQIGDVDDVRVSMPLHEQATQKHPDDSPSYSVDLRTPRQQQVWKGVKKQYAELLRLENESPELVYPFNWQRAFVNKDHLKLGLAPIHIGCMDEGVPAPEGGVKIGVAGSGVLMTDMDKLAGMTEEEIYEWLENPASGDATFYAFVEQIKARYPNLSNLTVSEHEGCGAVGIFCDMMKKKNQALNLDRTRITTAAAKRLHTALDLSGQHQRVGFGESGIRMTREPDIHDAYVEVIDGTGRFDPSKINMRALLLSGGKFLPETDTYLGEEVAAGRGIIKGAHGLGIESPVLVIGDPDNPACSAEMLQRRYASKLNGRRVIVVTAPQM